MKSLRFILIFSFILIEVSPLNLDIIEAYFRERSVNFATIFGCFNKSEHLYLYKKLSTGGESISILKINQKHFENNLITNNNQMAVIIDADCDEIEDFLIKCGKYKFFDSKHHWLIVSASSNIFEILKRVNLNINADIQLAIPEHEKLQNYTIFDIYNPAAQKGGQLITTRMGFYNKKDGYKARFSEAKFWIRRNMTDVTFKTIVVLPVPFEETLDDHLTSDKDPDVNTFNRFHCRLVHYCKNYYNFTLKIEVNDSWGYTKEDGTFDGLVGALDDESVDFGCSPLFVREDRGRVIEYGRRTWILRAAFIFRNPKARTSFEIFLKPFSTVVWLIILLIGLCAAIFLKIVTTFERNKYKFKVETTWSLSAILTLGAFCQQGFPKAPNMTCGRIVTIAIFLLSIIVYQFYSASIVSNLLMKPDTTLKSLADLIRSPIRAGCEDILYTKDFFKHSSDEEIKTLYKKKIAGRSNNSNYYPPEVGLEFVAKGDFAFHVEVATAYPIIESTFNEKAICELREIQLFRTQPMHANYQKYSPFRDMLDTCLHRLAEHGIIYRERIFWHPRKPECVNAMKPEDITVGILEFYPALVALLIGIGLSLGVLGLEIYLDYEESKRERVRSVRFVNEGRRIYPFVE